MPGLGSEEASGARERRRGAPPRAEQQWGSGVGSSWAGTREKLASKLPPTSTSSSQALSKEQRLLAHGRERRRSSLAKKEQLLAKFLSVLRLLLAGEDEGESEPVVSLDALRLGESERESQPAMQPPRLSRGCKSL